MSPTQVATFVAALNAVKSSGKYDDFVRRHVRAMMTPTPAGSSSNAAHCGPVFLPWHRAFLWEFETLLLELNPAVGGLPYWWWQSEARLNNGKPKLSRIWTTDLMGPDGDPATDNRVLTGPFKDWQAVIYDNTSDGFLTRDSPGLIRKLGRDPAGATSTLPTEAQITELYTHAVYDIAPYDKTTDSFRNRLEGWIFGPRLHNQVHRWVGGDMLAGTSPNDPVFWLHHANIDLIWWKWQNVTAPRRRYAPLSPDGPIGQRSGDSLGFLLRTDWTPALVDDIRDSSVLGYQYI
ncbi:MAG: tyrosinase family protein [Nakamurella sp.]